jgi:hypothetical protein
MTLHKFYYSHFFILTCPHKREERRGIRTSDFRFMRRGPQPIELPLRDYYSHFLTRDIRIECILHVIHNSN